MPYNCAADSFNTKKLCSRLSSCEMRYFDGKQPFYVFEPPPPLGDFGVTYDDHLRFIGNRAVDFFWATLYVQGH